MKLIVSNWKDGVKTEAAALKLAAVCDKPGFVLCPPKKLFDAVHGAVRHAALGMQDYAKGCGKRGARYALIGHSSRRAKGESASAIAHKVASAMADHVSPILCVGEDAEEHALGMREQVLRVQAIGGISFLLKMRRSQLPVPLFIAYEPVWAISSSKGGAAATPHYAAARIAFLKEQMLHVSYKGVIRYLYGGSVTAKNASGFIAGSDVDGLLVGGASVKVREITKLWQETRKSKN